MAPKTFSLPRRERRYEEIWTQAARVQEGDEIMPSFLELEKGLSGAVTSIDKPRGNRVLGITAAGKTARFLHHESIKVRRVIA